MTDSTDRVLASIDEAIDGYVTEDWAVGGDAMRWQPERPPEPGKAYLAPLGTLADGPRAWAELGRVADGGFAVGGAESLDASRRLNEQITAQVRVNVEAVRGAFVSVAETVRQVGKAFAVMANRTHPVLAPAAYGDNYRRHRRACRLCNPAGNPKPLRVNGAEYRRRTRARRHKSGAEVR